MSIGLTKRQSDCLSIITATISDTGRPPSFEEIASGLGLKSKSDAHRVVAALEARGRIRRMPGRARALEVLQPDAANDRGHNARINPEISRLVMQYAAEQNILFDTAVNELLRGALGADQ